jgi:hypothetical protein
MQKTISKTKSVTKKPTNSKRIILDYSKNPSFDYKITTLHDYYGGLSKVEITKLAVIEFFKNHVDNNKIYITDEEEKSLAMSIASGKYPKYTLKTDENSKEFLQRLVNDKTI